MYSILCIYIKKKIEKLVFEYYIKIKWRSDLFDM